MGYSLGGGIIVMRDEGGHEDWDGIVIKDHYKYALKNWYALLFFYKFQPEAGAILEHNLSVSLDPLSITILGEEAS